MTAQPAAIQLPKLLHRMAAAAPSADFVAMLHEYQPLLRRVARLYCQDADDRQDLFQEIVLQLWRAYPRYVPQPGATGRQAQHLALPHRAECSHQQLAPAHPPPRCPRS